MIVTEYIGQLYEVSDLSNLYLWGGVSTVFFIIMNYIVGIGIKNAKPTLQGNVSPTVMKILWLMMFAWTLYPIAYLIPAFMNSADGVVLRQLLFTIADISSKVTYGLMVTYVAIRQSAAVGYVPAQQVLGRMGVDRTGA